MNYKIETNDDLSFNNGEIGDLQKILNSYFSNRKKPLFTFLSGSIVEKLSTVNSDLDVYAVYADCDEREDLVLEGRRPIEITSISATKFDAIFEVLKHDSQIANMSPYELLLCHRLHTGVAINNPERFDLLKANLDMNLFRRRLNELCSLYGERSMRVTLGNLDSDDSSSALLNTVHALKQALNRLLVTHGATSLLEKWQLCYAKKYMGDTHLAYKCFIGLMSNVPYGASTEQTTYLASAFRFLQAICDYALLHPLMEENEFWHSSRLYRQDTYHKKMVITKSPYARVVISNGSYYLIVGATPTLEIPKKAALFWALINNSESISEVQNKGKILLDVPIDVSMEYLKNFAEIEYLNINNIHPSVIGV